MSFRSIATNYSAYHFPTDQTPRRFRFDITDELRQTIENFPSFSDWISDYEPPVRDMAKIPTDELYVSQNTQTHEFACFFRGKETAIARYNKYSRIYPYFGLTGSTKGTILAKLIFPLPGMRSRYGGVIGTNDWFLGNNDRDDACKDAQFQMTTRFGTHISWTDLESFFAEINSQPKRTTPASNYQITDNLKDTDPKNTEVIKEVFAAMAATPGIDLSCAQYFGALEYDRAHGCVHVDALYSDPKFGDINDKTDIAKRQLLLPYSAECLTNPSNSYDDGFIYIWACSPWQTDLEQTMCDRGLSRYQEVVAQLFPDWRTVYRFLKLSQDPPVIK